MAYIGVDLGGTKLASAAFANRRELRIKTEARRWAQPIAIEQVRFVGSTLGSDAGLFDAGRLAMTPRGERAP